MASSKSAYSTSSDKMMAELIAISNELQSELQNLEQESGSLNILARETEDKQLPPMDPGRRMQKLYPTQELTHEEMDPPSYSRRMNVNIDDLMNSVMDEDQSNECLSKNRLCSKVSSSLNKINNSVSESQTSTRRASADPSSYPRQSDSVRSARCA